MPSPYPDNELRLTSDPAAQSEADRDPALATRLAAYSLNDTGNAQRLVERFGERLGHVVDLGWFVWDGRRWRRDEGEIVARQLAQRTAQAICHEVPHAGGPKQQAERAAWAVISGNGPRLAGMLKQAEPHLALPAEAMDADPWLLNTANGTLDLETGTLRAHDPADLLTSLVPVDYAADASCPLWERFLRDIFAGDEELIGFVQRAVGYSLTALTREQALFILHGHGSNGKSVFLEVLAALLADYSRQCPSGTFLARDRGDLSNDIARLRCARFVSGVETESGKRLAENLVKQATSGDRLTARLLHREFFEFTPVFKLWLATNHRPEIQGTDNGIWRRVRLIPFNVTFKSAAEAAAGESVRDERLAEKLAAELPGILAWAVRGCLAWRQEGLGSPAAVRRATNEYREEQDVFGTFLAERCELAANGTVRAGVLYENYTQWAAANGEKAISSTALALRLKERGFAKGRGNSGVRIWHGIDVKEEFKPQRLGSSEAWLRAIRGAT